MANPIPCAGCGQVPDADFIVTNRAGGEWFGLPPSAGLCVSCLIAVVGRIETALLASMDDHPSGGDTEEAAEAAQSPADAPEEPQEAPEAPGVLEAVEAAEGPQEVRPEPTARRRRKSGSPSANGQQAVAEAQTADVDG